MDFRCFVIMPFDNRFDDVYQAIKTAANNAAVPSSIQCRRLDEIRGSGKITEDLINEIAKAAFCIADLTGNNANVMWEVGYAMALNKPTIFMTQDRPQALPFDIRDMRTHFYNRDALAQTVTADLQEPIKQTLARLSGTPASITAQHSQALAARRTPGTVVRAFAANTDSPPPEEFFPHTVLQSVGENDVLSVVGRTCHSWLVGKDDLAIPLPLVTNTLTRGAKLTFVVQDLRADSLSSPPHITIDKLTHELREVEQRYEEATS